MMMMIMKLMGENINNMLMKTPKIWSGYDSEPLFW